MKQICKLRQENTELCDSHIIPEWMYKSLYDGIHRYHVVSTTPEDKNIMAQKGYYEKLLCKDCEQLLSPIEKYAREVFYGGVTIDLLADAPDRFIFCVDYAKMKLFQLSVLWRAGVAKGKFFAQVQLGPHEDIIRQMLIAGDPGDPLQYGCYLIAIHPDPKVSMDALILSPEALRVEDHRCYRFVMGGCLWIYVVSGHSDQIRHKDLFMNKSGELPLLKGPKAENTELFVRLSQELSAANKLPHVG